MHPSERRLAERLMKQVRRFRREPDRHESTTPDPDLALSKLAYEVWQRELGVGKWSVLEVHNADAPRVQLQLEYLSLASGSVMDTPRVATSHWVLAGRGLRRDGHFAQARAWAGLHQRGRVLRRHLDGNWWPVLAPAEKTR